MRNTAADREHKAAKIRAAIESLLNEGSAGGPHNVKALADKAGITRSALYSDRYAPLKDEYLRRAAALSLLSLRDENTTELSKRIKVLEAKLREKEEMAEEFKRFRTLAISRLAGQHDMLLHYWEELRALGGGRPGQSPDNELAVVFPLGSPLQGRVGGPRRLHGKGKVSERPLGSS